MSTPEKTEEETLTKSSKVPVLLGIIGAILGGGGAFYAVYSGLVLGGGTHEPEMHKAETEMVEGIPEVAFVPVEPLVISLGHGNSGSHLRFRAQLEVGPSYKEEVEQLMPRIVDVLNSYLRALNTSDLEDSAALVRLRSQMLRRVQIVTGGDRIKNLLIMEFVLN